MPASKNVHALYKKIRPASFRRITPIVPYAESLADELIAFSRSLQKPRVPVKKL